MSLHTSRVLIIFDRRPGRLAMRFALRVEVWRAKRNGQEKDWLIFDSQM